MTDMVSVPAEKIAALTDALIERTPQTDPKRFKTATVDWMWLTELQDAARAVVDAVETEDEPLCRCGHAKSWHTSTGSNEGWTRCNGSARCMCHEFTPTPSPARDDAEKAIAGLLAEHGCWREDGYTRCECGLAFNDGHPNDDDHRAHVASVIAAHMAAPDELTALRRERDDARFFADQYKAALHNATDRDREHMQKIAAERDALRERIRALAHTSKRWVDGDGNHCGYIISTDELDAALGDA